MRIRLHFDEDSMHHGLVRALRARGVDVVTALVGDFYRLHAGRVSRGDTHAGVILMQQQRSSVGERMRRLLRLIASRSAEDMENRAEFLTV